MTPHRSLRHARRRRGCLAAATALFLPSVLVVAVGGHSAPVFSLWGSVGTLSEVLPLPQESLKRRRVLCHAADVGIAEAPQDNALQGTERNESLVGQEVSAKETTAVASLTHENDSFAVDTSELSAEQWGPAGFVLRVLAAVGAADCAYLTAVKLGQAPLVCPVNPVFGCNEVLTSPWASVGPIPLAAFGLAAYLAVFLLSSAGDWTRQGLLWWLCLLMAVVSLALEALILLAIQAPCVYCAVSAFCSALLLAVVDAGQRRVQGRGSRRLVLVLSALVVVGSLWVGTLPPRRADSGFYELTQKYKPEHPPVRSVSSEAEIALARHLSASGAHCYTAWWCPHCQEQREQFGAQAASLAPFVQCSTLERKTKQECKDQGIEGYPMWLINGKKYGGVQELAELANYSGFTAYPASSFQPRSDEVTEYIWGKQEEEAEPDDRGE